MLTLPPFTAITPLPLIIYDAFAYAFDIIFIIYAFFRLRFSLMPACRYAMIADAAYAYAAIADD